MLPITPGTADFLQKVLGVYTRSMEAIYLSLRALAAVGTFFIKSPVVNSLSVIIFRGP